MKNDTGRIYTSSWFTRLPPNMLRIGISRGTPQRQPAGFRRLPELTPGPWFNSVSADELFHRRYIAQLAGLDPKAVLARISDMAAGHDVALLCYESPTDPAKWCHHGQRLGLARGYAWDRGVRIRARGPGLRLATSEIAAGAQAALPRCRKLVGAPQGRAAAGRVPEIAQRYQAAIRARL